MAIYFVDSSALLKRYRNEAGSAHVLDLLENAENIWVSRLTAVEVSAALTRRAKASNLSQGDLLKTFSLLDADLSGYFDIIELDRPIMSQAISIARQHGLMGADAIQLASALFIRREIIDVEIVFLSSDLELNAAAAAEGLRVENPNSRP